MDPPPKKNWSNKTGDIIKVNFELLHILPFLSFIGNFPRSREVSLGNIDSGMLWLIGGVSV